MLRSSVNALLLVLAGVTAWSAPALAQVEPEHRWWLGAGLGGAAVHSPLPAPAAGRNAFAASVDFGYRFTPQWGLGLEFGTVAPVDGCGTWACADTPASFAPDFTRLFAFGEFRPRDTGWRFRAGAGVSRSCYSRHWSDTAWGWGDAAELIVAAMLEQEPVDDGGSGAYRCDGRMTALGGTLTAGYDWPVAAGSPVSVGMRLSAEAANFGGTPAIGMPAFHHRAVMLTLHLRIN